MHPRASFSIEECFVLHTLETEAREVILKRLLATLAIPFQVEAKQEVVNPSMVSRRPFVHASGSNNQSSSLVVTMPLCLGFDPSSGLRHR